MLKLVEEHEVYEIVSFLENQGAIGTRIGAYLRCYRTKMNHINFWFQEFDEKVATVVSQVDGDMTICATDRSDYDEIKEFIGVIGCNTLFMSADDYYKMGIIPDRVGNILKYNGNVQTKQAIEVSYDFDLKSAYDMLCENHSQSIIELDYLPWLSDFMYKHNRNSARAMCIKQDGKQMCFAMTSAETNKTALISGVVTDKQYRNRGFASALVTAIANELNDENKVVYVMTATSDNQKFYEKNGFVCIGRWGSSDRMI